MPAGTGTRKERGRPAPVSGRDAPTPLALTDTTRGSRPGGKALIKAEGLVGGTGRDGRKLRMGRAQQTVALSRDDGARHQQRCRAAGRDPAIAEVGGAARRGIGAPVGRSDGAPRPRRSRYSDTQAASAPQGLGWPLEPGTGRGPGRPRTTAPNLQRRRRCDRPDPSPLGTAASARPAAAASGLPGRWPRCPTGRAGSAPVTWRNARLDLFLQYYKSVSPDFPASPLRLRYRHCCAAQNAATAAAPL